MATKPESKKIAEYVARYSNKSSGAGYKGAIESFLRSAYNLPKTDDKGKKASYDYESLFEQYITDDKRNHGKDVKAFVECLNRVSKSKQSTRQILTYAVKFLRSHGVTISPDFVQDIKRETKGGAETIAKPLSGDKICHALKGASVRDRAIILCLASSGLRIGELLSLDMKDIDLNSNPVMITIRASKSKNKHSRFTFITPEAADAVRLWLDNRAEYIKASSKHNQNLIAMNRSAPVQTDSNLLFPVSDSMINAAWETCLRKAGLYLQDEDTGRNIYRLHSLRKFFDTTLSNTDMPEKLVQYFIGHLSELENKYYVPTIEHASAQYLKYQDSLSCCTDERTKAKINGLAIRTEELETIVEEVKEDKKEQRESIEYLRAMHKKDQENIAIMQKAIEGISAQVARLLDEKKQVAYYEMPADE